MTDIHGPATLPPTSQETVRALLSAAGLRPTEAEIETISAHYRGFRAAADRLRAIVYDDDPAPVFDPVRMFSGSASADGDV
jgi:hypothetical protein